MNELNTYSNFSGLKPNKTKCEIAGIGVLNGVHVALCGMKCVNLNKEIVKILGIHFSHTVSILIWCAPKNNFFQGWAL